MISSIYNGILVIYQKFFYTIYYIICVKLWNIVECCGILERDNPNPTPNFHTFPQL